MAYTFPIIENINQVLPYVEGREDFIVGQWDNEFILIDYTTIVSSTFRSEDPEEEAMLRECRGLLFYTDGNVARRAYHKFFNLNEAKETSFERLATIQPSAVMEKLDGSMVAPFVWPDSGEIYWASMRGSKTYHQLLAPQYDDSKQAELVHIAYCEGLTAIFEYCAPDNRIVIFYEHPQLILTGLRDKRTGIYVSYEQVCAWAVRFSVPVVGVMETTDVLLSELMAKVWKMDDAEGSVVRFEDGTLTKLKGEWYIQLHKLLSYFEFEKDIAWLVLSGKEDDLIGILQEGKRLRLEKYRDLLRASMMVLAKEMEHWCEQILSQQMDKKTFATFQNGPHHIVKHTVFKHWDNLKTIEIMPCLIEAALHNTSRSAKWDTFKKENSINVQWTLEIIEEEQAE